MNDITLIEHLSVDSLTEALQEAGYRVNRSEQNGVVQLLSASQGIPAVASMRCGTHLVDEGDSVEQVLERCGQPLSRIVNEPALRNNGVPKLNAACTEFWVYGPSGGVYRHLRFIDGKLVEIRLERK